MTTRKKPAKKSSKRTAPKLYKVLVNGASCHGGALKWSLPTQTATGKWRPGAWAEVVGDIVLCSNGLHLTDDPARWWVTGAECYEVEAEGVVGSCDADPNRKVAARRVRLVRALSDADLADLRVLRFGEHEIKTGIVAVDRSAQVTACGSAQVTACDSAQVTACGSAQVTACDSAQVTACGSAQVTAIHKVVVTSYWGSATVSLADRAVHVDQRGATPTVTTAAGKVGG
jgi:hypothetical protein